MDVAACTDRGVLLWSNTGAHGATNATAEQTVALNPAAMGQRSQQMASATAGNWQTGVGRTLRGRTLGLCSGALRLRADRPCDGGLRLRPGCADPHGQSFRLPAMSPATIGAPTITMTMRVRWWVMTKPRSAPVTMARTVISA